MAAGSALVAVALGWAGTTWVLSNGPASSLGGPTMPTTIPLTTIPLTTNPLSTTPLSPTPNPPTPPGSVAPPTCAQTIAAGPLERRVAQLLMIQIELGAPDPTTYATAGVGGLVLLGHVASDRGSVLAAANRAFSSAAGGAGQPPPFVATDEEGGGVARLSDVIPPLPWQRQQAAQWTPAQLQGVLATHAAAMRSLGFTMDLAPVLDDAPRVSPPATRGFGPTARPPPRSPPTGWPPSTGFGLAG